jgi:hypothetical protein
VYFLYPAGPLRPDDLSALDFVQTIVRDVGGLTAAAGAKYVVAFVPTKFRALAPHLEIPPGSDVGRWRLNDLPERFAKMVRQAAPDAVWIDLTPDLAASAARGNLPYLPDDSHWNDLGNRIAGEVLARAIRGTPGLTVKP